MHADGTDVLQLTDSPQDDGDPAWSPTGKQIVFASDRDFQHDRYVMDTDGSHVVRIVHSPDVECCAVWGRAVS